MKEQPLETGLALVSSSPATPAPMGAHKLQPNTFEEVLSVARWIVGSRWFDHIESPEQAAVIIMQGRELGLPAMVSITDISVIKGKPTLSSALQVAIIRSHPECEYMDLVESSAESATWASKRRGRPELRSTFDLAEARQMGLFALGKKRGKDGKPTDQTYQLHPGWHSQPKTMLVWRAASFHGRYHWSDVLKNLAHSTEEMSETVEPVQAVVVLDPEPGTPTEPEKGSRLMNAIKKAKAPEEDTPAEPEPEPEPTKTKAPPSKPVPEKGPELDELRAIWKDCATSPLGEEAARALWGSQLAAIERYTTTTEAKASITKARQVLAKIKLAMAVTEAVANVRELSDDKPQAPTDLRKVTAKDLKVQLAALTQRLEKIRGGQ